MIPPPGQAKVAGHQPQGQGGAVPQQDDQQAGDLISEDKAVGRQGVDERHLDHGGTARAGGREHHRAAFAVALQGIARPGAEFTGTGHHAGMELSVAASRAATRASGWMACAWVRSADAPGHQNPGPMPDHQQTNGQMIVIGCIDARIKLSVLLGMKARDRITCGLAGEAPAWGAGQRLQSASRRPTRAT